MLARYTLFEMARVRYVGTLFEFTYKTFYVQRAALNQDLSDCAQRAHSLGYSPAIIIAS